MIKNAVRHYNQRARKYSGFINGGLSCDEMMESLNVKLSDTELLLLSNILGYTFCRNKLNEFVSVYSVFAKEMGFKDYKNQLDGRNREVERFEEEITRIIHDEFDTFSLG